MKIVIKDILEVDIKYPKNLHNMHVDLPFLPERMKIKKCTSLFVICMIKNKYVVHVTTLILIMD